ncbi:MAG: HAMP domain-containing histidine kinase [Pseudomonadota bacterium]|nr:HAMP domain-containing histidine kinase [Pseudomonadota bacterium]
MRHTHSLRIRLLGGMLAVFALGLVASLISYRYQVHHIVKDVRGRTLEAQARELLVALHTGANGRPELNLSENWQHVYADPAGYFSYTIFDQAHQPIARSPNLRTLLAYLAADGASPLGAVEFTGVGADRRAVLAARSPEGWVLVVARSGADPDILIDSLFEEDSENLLAFVPLAILALSLIWLISGWSLRPIARASREAALVGPREPDMRISLDGLPREIQPLVEAVNGALDRLSSAYSTERRLTADAAHELRTPLAVLNLRLQRARMTGSTDWPAVEREFAQMSRLVDQLLDLARKETVSREGSREQAPVVNLSRTVREAASMVVPLIEAQGRALLVDVPDVVPLRGGADDLRDMIRNLLDNALIHGQGTVSASIRPPSDAGWITIDVTDEGPGVPAGQEEAIFERFRKLSAQSCGSGLGLAIVRQVARTHGGEVRFVAGRGWVVVTLPAIAPRGAPAPGYRWRTPSAPPVQEIKRAEATPR